MPRRSKNQPEAQGSLLEPTGGKSGIVVPAVKKAVAEWRLNDYKGATPTSYKLLNYWFRSDHVLGNGQSFRYHEAQREAIETLIYLYEVAKVRRRTPLILNYAPRGINIMLPRDDNYARYAIKMATGSGKTKVMALAIAWQYLNAVRESNADYADTFLLIAPNVIVFERLQSDFAGGRIFQTDPIIPREMRMFWDFQVYLRGDSERGGSQGALYLTNIQQLYEREGKGSDVPDAIAGVLGPEPPSSLQQGDNFIERISKRGNCMVLNDEAHHTHDADSAWSETIDRLHLQLRQQHDRDLTAQLDFSATPRYGGGELFEWVVYDYPLRRAIIDGIVKRPLKGIASDIKEKPARNAGEHYSPYLIAGVERWQEYREQLQPLGKKPVLFVMMNDTGEADQVAEWLRLHYQSDFGDGKLLVIHTDKAGEVSKKDLDIARKASREVDSEDSPINCIVSVLMLREGWDVRNVTVVVGLRPYTSKANILPEQTVGRGLRLMWPTGATNYLERVDVIGSDAFLDFVAQLEKDEDIKFETFKLGKDKVNIVTIQPMLPEKAAYDIEVPFLSPTLQRTRLEAEVINNLDVDTLTTVPLPLSVLSVEDDENFKYEGYDLIDRAKLVDRVYKLQPDLSTDEVIAYYTIGIAEQLKLTGQFALLQPKVYEFIRQRVFGREVDLEDKGVGRAISTAQVMKVTTGIFVKALRPHLIEESTETTLVEARKLSSVPPYPWSRQLVAAQHTIYNYAACGNDLEKRFAEFLDRAKDVQAFAKIPDSLGFSIEYTDINVNLRHYFPDFIVRQEDETVTGGTAYWIIETKGLEGPEVHFKDKWAKQWAAAATAATGHTWHYLKVAQKEFDSFRPSTLGELAAVLNALGAMLL